MIMEIGRYKDTRRILPETLKEIENMEQHELGGFI